MQHPGGIIAEITDKNIKIADDYEYLMGRRQVRSADQGSQGRSGVGRGKRLLLKAGGAKPAGPSNQLKQLTLPWQPVQPATKEPARTVSTAQLATKQFNSCIKHQMFDAMTTVFMIAKRIYQNMWKKYAFENNHEDPLVSRRD